MGSNAHSIQAWLPADPSQRSFRALPTGLLRTPCASAPEDLGSAAHQPRPAATLRISRPPTASATCRLCRPHWMSWARVPGGTCTSMNTSSKVWYHWPHGVPHGTTPLRSSKGADMLPAAAARSARSACAECHSRRPRPGLSAPLTLLLRRDTRRCLSVFDFSLSTALWDTGRTQCAKTDIQKSGHARNAGRRLAPRRLELHAL